MKSSILAIVLYGLVLSSLPEQVRGQSDRNYLANSSISPPRDFDKFLAVALSRTNDFALKDEWVSPSESDLLVVFVASQEDVIHVPKPLTQFMKNAFGVSRSHMYTGKNLLNSGPFANVALIDVNRMTKTITQLSGFIESKPLLSCVSAFYIVDTFFKDQAV